MKSLFDPFLESNGVVVLDGALATELERRGADQVTELIRHVVAHGIRNVHGAGAGIDNRLEYPAQELRLGTTRIFGGKLHVVRVVACPSDRVHRLCHHLVRAHAQLFSMWMGEVAMKV